MQLRFPKTKERRRREAARWLARVQGGRDPDTERKFERWYGSDPANAIAYDRVRRSYDQAGLLRTSERATADAGRPAKQAVPAPRYALAAAVALAVLLPAGLVVADRYQRDTGALMLVTKVGEIRRVTLSDGSSVTLDTGTRIEVEVGTATRRALLREGRARFEIAAARQPFVIESSPIKVSATSGMIDVERSAGNSRIDVLAGEALLFAPPDNEVPARLAAGESAAVRPGGSLAVVAQSGANDWTNGMLEFDGTPLTEAVERANRYSARPILVQGDVQRLRVTGAYRAGDTAGFAKALSAAFGFGLRVLPDGQLVLTVRASAPSEKKNGG